MLKERPILFNGEMVKAILHGRKTQTRRPVKGAWPTGTEGPFEAAFAPGMGSLTGHFALKLPAGNMYSIQCPFGRTGTRLWVRETFADTLGMGFDKRFHYAADTEPGSDGDTQRKAYGVKWKPSIHMPRAASRLSLEVTCIRVERCQDITENDAKAEGAQLLSKDGGAGWGQYDGTHPSAYTFRWGFKSLWDAAYSERNSFGTNPWVWVVEFKRTETC